MNRRRVDRSEQVQRTGAFVRAALTALVRLSAALLVTAAIGAACFYGWKFLRESPRFGVHELVFHGVVHASREELTRRAGLVAGTNIFAVDLARAARAMEEDPWVREARLVRELPATLRIEIDEHRPVAVVALGGLYAVDEKGQVFKRVTAADGLDLPVITGLEREDVESGRDADVLKTALELLDEYQRSSLAKGVLLSELHVGVEDGETSWTAYLGDQAVEARLGTIDEAGVGAPSEVLGRLARVWSELARRGVRVRSIDVGNRRRPDWVAARIE